MVSRGRKQARDGTITSERVVPETVTSLALLVLVLLLYEVVGPYSKVSVLLDNVTFAAAFSFWRLRSERWSRHWW